MNSESVGLIIFAFIALGAVFAFILVLGGPEKTGELSGTQKIGATWYKYREANRACSIADCNDGLPGIPTGNYDALRELYECVCQTSQPSFVFYRSAFSPG